MSPIHTIVLIASILENESGDRSFDLQIRSQDNGADMDIPTNQLAAYIDKHLQSLMTLALAEFGPKPTVAPEKTEVGKLVTGERERTIIFS